MFVQKKFDMSIQLNTQEEKKSFILYNDMIANVKKIGHENAGKLLYAILDYVNGEEVDLSDDLVVDLVFEPIKQHLNRNAKKWGDTTKERSDNGKVGNLKRWHPDLYSDFQDGKRTLDESLIIANYRKTSGGDFSESQKIANIAVNDNVNGSVNGSESETVNGKESENVTSFLEKEAKKNSEEKKFTTKDFKSILSDLGAEKKLIDSWLSNRSKRRLANTEAALEGFLKEVEKSGQTINDILRLIGENGWGGFKSDWIKNLNKNNYGNKTNNNPRYSDDFKRGLFEKLQSQ